MTVSLKSNPGGLNIKYDGKSIKYDGKSIRWIEEGYSAECVRICRESRLVKAFNEVDLINDDSTAAVIKLSQFEWTFNNKMNIQ